MGSTPGRGSFPPGRGSFPLVLVLSMNLAAGYTMATRHEKEGMRREESGVSNKKDESSTYIDAVGSAR